MSRPSRCLSNSESTLPVSAGGSQVSPWATPRRTRSRCSTDSSLRTQARAPASMAATILDGSDVWLSMMTWVSFGVLEVALQNRMDPARSTSSRMMSACQPMVVAAGWATATT